MVALSQHRHHVVIAAIRVMCHLASDEWRVAKDGDKTLFWAVFRESERVKPDDRCQMDRCEVHNLPLATS